MEPIEETRNAHTLPGMVLSGCVKQARQAGREGGEGGREGGFTCQGTDDEAYRRGKERPHTSRDGFIWLRQASEGWREGGREGRREGRRTQKHTSERSDDGANGGGKERPHTSRNGFVGLGQAGEAAHAEHDPRNVKDSHKNKGLREGGREGGKEGGVGE